ncbi:50S ribosomal protein L29 [Iamia sp. SCSIO 61187]|uniref:50S ribosomal protein L29 n=1 Tax=Iamia sp. SCSIO 61187 TaxID=2722752 RepID=UPI001C639F64|nr:50S ribosomal protein L29 [Iamia sp. SCSIO 61187]QYG91579.1 50S ribosomal protein L29 [Iamia sp. SCSIO 61187]
MAKTDITDLDDHGLEVRLAETREELFNLRFRRATGQLENGASILEARRQVARILTEQRSREIAAAESQEASA